MKYIDRNTAIDFKWSIWKGDGGEKEDFSCASLYLFLEGPDGKRRIEACDVDEDGDIIGSIEAGTLVPGIYSFKLVWSKEPAMQKRDLICCIRRCVFGITAKDSEADEVDEESRGVIITMKSRSASYGMDGLSAYERAVMLGITDLPERLWVGNYAELSNVVSYKIEEAAKKLQENFDEAIAAPIKAIVDEAVEYARIAKDVANDADATAREAKQTADGIRSIAGNAAGAANEAKNEAARAREIAAEALRKVEEVPAVDFADRIADCEAKVAQVGALKDDITRLNDSVDQLGIRTIVLSDELSNFTGINASAAVINLGLDSEDDLFDLIFRPSSNVNISLKGYTLQLQAYFNGDTNSVIFGAMGSKTGLIVEIVEEYDYYSCYIQQKAASNTPVNYEKGYYGTSDGEPMLVDMSKSFDQINGTTVSVRSTSADKKKCHWIAVKEPGWECASITDVDGDDISSEVRTKTLGNYKVYYYADTVYIDNTTKFTLRSI